MNSDFFDSFKSFQTAGKGAYKPGLERMEFLDQMMGHPHRRYRCVHVAGTNGKGSVSNMLASLLSSTGLKVGLYTSPHILDLRERARVIDGDGVRLIDGDSVDRFVAEWGETSLNLGLSFFEVTTAMAFWWFAEEKVDWAVIEVGLGGRMDSTNIIMPELSVITNIGLDHCDILGETLPEIAYEKAGIIKPLVPVVVGESSSETDPVFERKVLYTNLPEAEFMGDRNRIMSLLTFADKTEPSGWNGSETLLGEMDLQGCYQRKNLRTVLAALDRLSGKVPGLVAGGRLSDDAVNALVHTASRMDFHGRWERLQKPGTAPDGSPLCEVICDIGHNAHGLKYNFAQLERLQSEGRHLIIVYGSVADKDVDAVLRLMPSGADIFFTNADNGRALPAADACSRYLRCCEETGREPSRTSVVPSVAEAVAAALSLGGKLAADGGAQPLLYIGGSTYVVSEAVRCF